MQAIKGKVPPKSIKKSNGKQKLPSFDRFQDEYHSQTIFAEKGEKFISSDFV